MAFQVGKMQHSPLGEYLSKGITKGIDTMDRRKEAFLGKEHEIALQTNRQGFQTRLSQDEIAARLRHIELENTYNNNRQKNQQTFDRGEQDDQQQFDLDMFDSVTIRQNLYGKLQNDRANQQEKNRYWNEIDIENYRDKNAHLFRQTDPDEIKKGEIYEENKTNEANLKAGAQTLDGLLGKVYKQDLTLGEALEGYDDLSDEEKKNLSFSNFYRGITNFYETGDRFNYEATIKEKKEEKTAAEIKAETTNKTKKTLNSYRGE